MRPKDRLLRRGIPNTAIRKALEKWSDDLSVWERIWTAIVVLGLGIEIFDALARFLPHDVFDLIWPHLTVLGELSSALVFGGVLGELVVSSMSGRVETALRAENEAIIEATRERAALAEQRAAEANLELAKLKQPRTLLPEQQENITSVMKFFGGQRFAFCVFSDPESLDLARTLDAILKSAEWIRIESQIGAVVVDVAGVTAGITYDPGVRVFIAPDDSGATNALAALAGVLTHHGIPCSPHFLMELTGKTPKAITISVGKKP